MSDDLYLKVWLDAVDAATGEPTIKFKPAANNAAAAILRERFVPRVTGPHDGLIERLRSMASVERWSGSFTVRPINPDGPEAAAAIASLQAELDEAREAMECALRCTPHIRDNQITYECGDPWEILRAALENRNG